MNYRPALHLREESVPPPTELQMQAIWFEQWLKPDLFTDDGRRVEVIQAGFWNHGPGPDFKRAVIKISPPLSGSTLESKLLVGNVEMHLRAADWSVHGHDVNAAYEDTLLHVVWEKGSKTFYPATESFRTIPQLILSKFLVAPWSQLASASRNLIRAPLPQAKPGRCHAELNVVSQERVTEIIRNAGEYRLDQKVRALFWREHLFGLDQALFEALAEALGFHANQIPMRLLSQRLPYKKLRTMKPLKRLALLFGLAGFLPGHDISDLTPEAHAWVLPLWEYWWKERDALNYALLERSDWQLAGLRPLNRPERRIAALAQIIPLLPQLLHVLHEQGEETFTSLLLQVSDPFWEHRATLQGRSWKEPHRLLGAERIRDILINVFWPFVARKDKEAAVKGWKNIQASENRSSHAATQRLLISLLPKRQRQEALIQQGLLQIFRDYCQTDCSDCRQCRFPELISEGQI